MTSLDLPPAWRRAIYGALTLAFAALVVVGQITSDNVESWLTVAATILALAASVMAAIKAKRLDFQRLYAAAGAVATALVVVGVLSQSDVDSALVLAGKVVAFLTMGLATARTDPSTPTGQPVGEYDPKHDDPIGA